MYIYVIYILYILSTSWNCKAHIAVLPGRWIRHQSVGLCSHS